MSGLFGVIGAPIAHSLSPVIHRGWMRDLGIDADYRAFRIPAGELKAGLEALERDGIRGLNVTLPHKMDILSLCEQLTPLAEDLGAVNTLTRTPSGGWVGDNTDYQGFLEDFHAAHDGHLAGCSILVLGAGGAAQSIARGLHAAGYKIQIANRTHSRAVALAERIGLPAEAAQGLEDLERLSRSVDAVVNTLSSGHSGETLSLDAGRGRLFYDISYGKAAAGNLASAAAAGWTTFDGLGMLVAQAALSFDIWHGVAPDRATALERCRTALEMSS